MVNAAKEIVDCDILEDKDDVMEQIGNWEKYKMDLYEDKIYDQKVIKRLDLFKKF